MYIHSTDTKIKIDNIKNVKQVIYFKPRGFWYAKNNDWIDWAKKNLSKIYKYQYSVSFEHTLFGFPDKKKILFLKTKRDLINFTIKFGKKYESEISDIIQIDWKQVAKLYGGIETKIIKTKPSLLIKKHFKTKKEYILWSESFDVHSGCIWNANAIESIDNIK